MKFVRLVNYMPKPTVFWHLADDPTIDRDGVEQAVRPNAPAMGGDWAVHVLDGTICGSHANTTLPAGTSR